MLAPIRGGNLVFDQRVDGFSVWDAQQCFGEAHQGDTFIRGQAILGKKDLHHAGIGLAANVANQLGPALDDARAIFGRQARLGLEARDGRSLVGISVLVDGVAHVSLSGHVGFPRDELILYTIVRAGRFPDNWSIIDRLDGK